jgi:hypothetical protein
VRSKKLVGWHPGWEDKSYFNEVGVKNKAGDLRNDVMQLFRLLIKGTKVKYNS